MSKIVVQKYTEKTTKNGKTKYECLGTIDGEFEKFDMWNAPKLKEEFEAQVKDDPQWGKTVLTGGGGSAGVGRSYGKSPEEQMMIVRQNALTNAVNRAIALAANMTPEEAQKALKPTNICMAAYHFARYTSGEWNPSASKIEQREEIEEARQDKILEDEVPYNEPPF